jgi:hypothetical protein
MSAMDRIIDLVDLIVYRVPTPAQLDLMSDLALETRYMSAVGRDRQRAGLVMAAEIDRRDQHARARRLIKERKDAARAAAAALRDEYDVWVHGEFLRAEEFTRGNLLSKRAAARTNDDGSPAIPDPIKLWHVSEATARAWASEELCDYWDTVSRRMTFAEWKRQSRETYDPTAPAAA